jgi:hypothetical protein
MRTRVSKWGNGLAIRLPQAAVRSLRVQQGEQVELTIEGDRIEIRPGRPRCRAGGPGSAHHARGPAGVDRRPAGRQGVAVTCCPILAAGSRR